MTSPEATLLRAGQVLDLKIMDDGLVHHFIINGSVDYGVLKCRGGLAARPDTVPEDLQQEIGASAWSSGRLRIFPRLLECPGLIVNGGQLCRLFSEI
jgi:hypothetical protein